MSSRLNDGHNTRFSILRVFQEPLPQKQDKSTNGVRKDKIWSEVCPHSHVD